MHSLKTMLRLNLTNDYFIVWEFFSEYLEPDQRRLVYVSRWLTELSSE